MDNFFYYSFFVWISGTSIASLVFFIYKVVSLIKSIKKKKKWKIESDIIELMGFWVVIFLFLILVWALNGIHKNMIAQRQFDNILHQQTQALNKTFKNLD